MYIVYCSCVFCCLLVNVNRNYNNICLDHAVGMNVYARRVFLAFTTPYMTLRWNKRHWIQRAIFKLNIYETKSNVNQPQTMHIQQSNPQQKIGFVLTMDASV